MSRAREMKEEQKRGDLGTFDKDLNIFSSRLCTLYKHSTLLNPSDKLRETISRLFKFTEKLLYRGTFASSKSQR